MTIKVIKPGQNPFISDAEFNSKKQSLLKFITLTKQCERISKKTAWSPREVSVLSQIKASAHKDLKSKSNILLDIIRQISMSKCDDNVEEKSTALHSQFNRNWTIGSMGSVFVDLSIRGEQYRVHHLEDSHIFIEPLN